MSVTRDSRIYAEPGHRYRTHAQVDCDRILNSSALRRLVWVKQVVNPLEGQIFHNRLTHTLMVAQIARRIAEKLLKTENPAWIERLGGLDPDVVQAAALAHDLGHPPFGHVGERVLNELVSRYSDDGFEGNAQSFRIVTKLATRRPEQPGLNLTFASLRAMQKYPWFKEDAHTVNRLTEEKWGIYHTEECEFAAILALGGGPETQRMALEAAIMDLADDIAYATHDVEDFFRAGLIPLHSLRPTTDPGEQVETKRFLAWVAEKRTLDFEQLVKIFNRLAFYFIPINESFKGTQQQKAILRQMMDNTVDSYLRFVTINPAFIEDITVRNALIFQESQQHSRAATDQYNQDLLLEIRIFKELTRDYVLQNMGIQTRRHGEQTIIKKLFEIYFEAIYTEQHLGILPADFAQIKQTALAEEGCYARQRATTTVAEAISARLAADYIVRFTDEEALRMYQRFTGLKLDALLDYQ